ncbi:hypothetical protein ACIRBZ_01270 [Streptomyces sp. NPDC094038]|uniref:hypothetical protein n=1 Tax=Streptomyces sp. NPDC094038 TaxID=3366055 RepID=UPI003800281D
MPARDSPTVTTSSTWASAPGRAMPTPAESRVSRRVPRPANVHTLTTYAVAGADGLFVHREVKGDSVDLVALFEPHARLIHDAAARMAAGDTAGLRSPRPRGRR